MKRRSSCFSSSHPRSRSAVAQSFSKAASEISEIEYIDDTDYDEPSLDDTDDQQTLESLEKELNELRNLAGNAIFFFFTINSINFALYLILHVMLQANKLFPFPL